MSQTINQTPVKTLQEISGTEGIPLSDKSHLSAGELKGLSTSVSQHSTKLTELEGKVGELSVVNGSLCMTFEHHEE